MDEDHGHFSIKQEQAKKKPAFQKTHTVSNQVCHMILLVNIQRNILILKSVFNHLTRMRMKPT